MFFRNPQDIFDMDMEKAVAIYNETIEFESLIGSVVCVVFGLIVVVGIIGNLSVVVIFSAKRYFHSSTNVLLINLAVAVLLFLLFCVPFTAADYAYRVWMFSETWYAM